MGRKCVKLNRVRTSVYTMQPVVQPYWQPVVSCKWGVLENESESSGLVDRSSAVAEMGDRLAIIDMGRKVRGWAAVPLSVGWAGSPSNTMSHGSRPTSVPSGILIHPAVCHNTRTLQTGKTDREVNGPVAYGGPALVTVAPKSRRTQIAMYGRTGKLTISKISGICSRSSKRFFFHSPPISPNFVKIHP